MRLWHKSLIPILPRQMLISQWRECIAIKRQWEKGTLTHRLVSYVKVYNKEYFLNYVMSIKEEFERRKIKHQDKYYYEIYDFCENDIEMDKEYQDLIYPEHNERYLMQCYHNLQEKFDRGIIPESEWKTIEKFMSVHKK